MKTFYWRAARVNNSARRRHGASKMQPANARKRRTEPLRNSDWRLSFTAIKIDFPVSLLHGNLPVWQPVERGGCVAAPTNFSMPIQKARGKSGSKINGRVRKADLSRKEQQRG